MKVTVSILFISPQYVGKVTVDELKAIYPEGYKEYHPQYQEFGCLRMPEDDPRLARIMKCLDASGLRPWADTSRERDRTREYVMRKFREYAPEDLEAAPVLELNPVDRAAAGYRDERGLIKIGVDGLPHSADIALASDEGWYVVPARTRKVLEAEGLRGIQFRATTPTLEGGFGRETSWQAGEEWWELTSHVSMPPLSPRLVRTDGLGRVLTDGDDSQGFIPREGLFATPELRYSASSLAAMPSFDLAKTCERMGNTPELERRLLIGSPQLYDFCRKHGLKTGWVPVRVDPN